MRERGDVTSASFSGEQRGRAIGTWSGFTGITSALGPVLGGWLVEQVSWRWIFFINVPLAVLVLGIRAIAESFVDGFRWVMLIAVGLALASALIAALMINGKGSRPTPVNT